MRFTEPCSGSLAAGAKSVRTAGLSVAAEPACTRGVDRDHSGEGLWLGARGRYNHRRSMIISTKPAPRELIIDVYDYMTGRASVRPVHAPQRRASLLR
jgi:hypothetical protein